MNIRTITILVIFLGVIFYTLREFLFAKEGFQVSSSSWSSNTLFTIPFNIDERNQSCAINYDGTIAAYKSSNTVSVKQLNGTSWNTIATLQNTDTNPIVNIDMCKYPDNNGLYSIAINTRNKSIIYKGSSGSWQIIKTIVIDQPVSSFDSQGNTIIIGSRYANSDEGLVKIVDLRTSTEFDLDGFMFGAGMFFGASVAINSDASIVAIGSFGDPQNIGTVKLCQLVNSEKDGFYIGSTELIEGNSINDFFGKSLSFDDSGKILAIGAEGYVKKYSISATSSTFNVSLIGTITSPLDRFGNFVKLSSSGDRLIVSAYQNDILIYNNNQQVSSISTNSTIMDIDANASGNTIITNEMPNGNVLVNVYTQMLSPAPASASSGVRSPAPAAVPTTGMKINSYNVQTGEINYTKYDNTAYVVRDSKGGALSGTAIVVSYEGPGTYTTTNMNNQISVVFPLNIIDGSTVIGTYSLPPAFSMIRSPAPAAVPTTGMKINSYNVQTGEINYTKYDNTAYVVRDSKGSGTSIVMSFEGPGTYTTTNVNNQISVVFPLNIFDGSTVIGTYSLPPSSSMIRSPAPAFSMIQGPPPSSMIRSPAPVSSLFQTPVPLTESTASYLDTIPMTTLSYEKQDTATIRDTIVKVIPELRLPRYFGPQLGYILFLLVVFMYIGNTIYINKYIYISINIFLITFILLNVSTRY